MKGNRQIEQKLRAIDATRDSDVIDRIAELRLDAPSYKLDEMQNIQRADKPFAIIILNIE